MFKSLNRNWILVLHWKYLLIGKSVGIFETSLFRLCACMFLRVPAFVHECGCKCICMLAWVNLHTLVTDAFNSRNGKNNHILTFWMVEQSLDVHLFPIPLGNSSLHEPCLTHVVLCVWWFFYQRRYCSLTQKSEDGQRTEYTCRVGAKDLEIQHLFKDGGCLGCGFWCI